MEFFRVTCVTCSARLSVRNADLVGQIVACPRCHSMVLIEAPPGFAASASADTRAPGLASADSAAEPASDQVAAQPPSSRPTERYVKPTERYVGPSPSPPHDAAAATPLPDERASRPTEPFFRAAPRSDAVSAATPQAPSVGEPPALVSPHFLAATAQLAEPAAHAAAVAEGGEEHGAQEVADDAVESASAPWQEAARQWLGGLGLGAAAGATVVAVWLALRPSEPPSKVAAPTPSASGSAPSAALVREPTAAEAPVARPAAPREPTESAVATLPAAASAAAAESPEVADEKVAAGAPPLPELPELPELPPAVAPEAAAAVPADVNAPRVAALDAPGRQGKGGAQLRVDPLDIDPEGLNWALLHDPAPRRPVWANSADAEAPAAAPAVEEIAEPAADAALPEGLAGAEAGDATPLAAGGSVRLDPAGTPLGTAPAAAAQLGQSVGALRIKDVPLVQALDLCGALAGAPISFDPQELRLASVRWTRPVRVEVQDADVAAALRALLEPLRLAAVPQDAQIVIERTGLLDRREVAYPIGDLVAPEFPATELEAWLRELTAPESWGEAVVEVQGDRLRVVQSERVQYEALFLLKRLRLERGLTPISKYPTDLLPPAAAELLLGERLAAPTTFTFSNYVPLIEVIRHWKAELGLEILVDWPSLEAVGLRPQSQLACRASDQSWSDALDAVLVPLDLDWRCVDGATLQIASRERLASQPQLAWYDIGKGQRQQLAAWRARVEAAVQAAGHRAAPTTTIKYDDASGRLVVRQSPAVHRALVASAEGLIRPAASGIRPQ